VYFSAMVAWLQNVSETANTPALKSDAERAIPKAHPQR
jgi:hypothetical protein